MSKKVAVVTGSNKGIGYAVVKGLCQQFQGDVYLTARNVDLGKAAVAELEKEGVKAFFHQLDISDQASINQLKDFLVKNYGGLDVLVNNAGMAYKGSSTAPFSEQAEVSMKTNFYGTLAVYNTLQPILRSQARVATVSSFTSATALSRCSPELQAKLKSLKTVKEVEQYMEMFVKHAKAGDHEANGWPSWAYAVTKLGLTLTASMLQDEVDKDSSRKDIIVNACCPGYVKTDMTSHKGKKTVEEGADTLIYLAMLPPNTTSPRGEFVSDRTIQQWR